MKYEALKGCIWKVMDVRTLDGIGDQEVGFANDKGTLDAFLYGSLWDPPSEVRENVGAYVDQVSLYFRFVSHVPVASSGAVKATSQSGVTAGFKELCY